MHILGIPGSLRQQSLNRALLVTAQELLPDGVTLEIFDLHDIPLFNSDVEAQGTPAPVLAFREQMKAADALLFAAPEYNFSISGVLKNAIDWASRKGPDARPPLNDKPAAAMGVGGMMGTLRAQLHLREILLHNNVYLLNQPTLLLARANDQFGDGRLVNEDSRERLARLLIALQAWTARFQ